MDVATTSSAISPRWRIGMTVGLLVLFLVVAIQYALKAAEDRSAFVRWQNQVLDVMEHKNIYDLYVYPNPPIMALILYPLARLPEVQVAGYDVETGALAWFLIKAGLTALAFFWAVRLIQQQDTPFPYWAQVLMLLLSLRPIIGDLSHGNVNLLILFLVVACLYAYHRGWDLTAGIVLGLAIACKVTPALFVPYFLWKRAWKSLLGCGLGLLLFLIVVPGGILGQAHNWELLTSWYEKMVAPFAAEGQVTSEHPNQSLPGVIYRLGTRNPSFLDAKEQPLEYHNLLELDPALARGIVNACGLAFLILLALACRTPAQPRDNWRLAVEYSLIALGMLLFSERTWKHHCVTLLLPFGVFSYYLATQKPRGWWQAYLLATLVAVVVLMTTTSTSVWEKLFNYRMGAKLAQVYGTYVWAYMLLLGALVAISFKHRQPRLESTTDGASGKLLPRFLRRPFVAAPVRQG